MVSRRRNVTLIAHRGHSAERPENTVAAFEAAARLDCVDRIECDVHLSADVEPVVIHDATVDRTTDGVGRVGELALPQLRALDAGSWFGPDHAGQRIATLGEYLDAIGRKAPLIELKDPAAADAVLSELKARGLIAHATVQCFDLDVLIALRLRSAELPLGWLIDRTPDAAMLEHVRGLGLSALGCRHDAITPASVVLAHRAGLAVWAWTVNEPAGASALAAAGVDGIITDDPPAVAGALG